MLHSRGLVGYWPLENTALDASGNSRNGTRFGTTYVAGRLGRALNFDGGAGDSVAIGVITHTAAPRTRAAWIRPTSFIAGDRAILSDYVSGPGSNMAFFHNHVSKRLGTYWGNSYMPSSSTDLTVDIWQHVAIVRSGSAGNWTGTYYLNGKVDGTFTTAVNPTAANLTLAIGRTGSYPGEYFYGDIDEVIDIERALSETDIRRLMLGMHPIS